MVRDDRPGMKVSFKISQRESNARSPDLIGGQTFMYSGLILTSKQHQSR